MAEEKKLVLISSDNETFEVPEAAALLSKTIKNALEDDDGSSAANGIPLRNVDSKTLAKVIEFSKRHAAADTNPNPDETPKQFIESQDLDALFDLILAANYMDIKELLGLVGDIIADRIKNFSVDEIRRVFNIENDFTKDEEEKIRSDHPWAFEGLDKDN